MTNDVFYDKCHIMTNVFMTNVVESLLYFIKISTPYTRVTITSKLRKVKSFIPLKKRDLIISELSRLNLSANSCTVKLSSGTIIISGLTYLASFI